jgi:hypothetical protein
VRSTSSRFGIKRPIPTRIVVTMGVNGLSWLILNNIKRADRRTPPQSMQKTAATMTLLYFDLAYAKAEERGIIPELKKRRR